MRVTIELTLLSRVTCRGQEVTAPRLRALLALLAADLRAGCGVARLVDGLWPEERPARPTKALQILVSRARSQLGPELIASTPTGYRLTLGEDQVDATAVVLNATEATRSAHAGDHAAALALAEDGLALWTGDGVGDETRHQPADTGSAGAAGDSSGLPTADRPTATTAVTSLIATTPPTGGDADALDDPVAALRADRLPTFHTLLRVRALSLARLGRYAEAVEPLTALARDQPRDEELLAELLRSEAATAGPATALARYESYRRELRDELGGDPGPALQAVHQQLLQDAAPTVRHGVPHEPNPLLGRDDDIATVVDLLRTSRVTSIVGAGGLGKTRLAYAVSHRTEHRAVLMVPLAGVTSDADVAGEVASALGAGDSWATTGRRTIRSDVVANIVRALASAPSSVLLVLDNCEHVIAGVADLVSALVAMTRNLQVLTTSRTPLGLSSEAVYPLPELALPTAVELFHQRARAVRPDVDLPADEVGELCRRLDGLPLAVELAAARVRAMSVAEISRRLENRFALLRGGARDAPERHHTLAAVVDWSWNLLDTDGQAALRRLSIFPDGFTVDAARYVLGSDNSTGDTGDAADPVSATDTAPLGATTVGTHATSADPDDLDILATLENLVDQSLIKAVDTPAGTRFRMLETVREFSATRRDAAGETDDALAGFLSWARDFGAANHEVIFAADVTAVTVRRLRDEQDNLLRALRYALDRSDLATVAATAAVLGTLWLGETSYARVARLVAEVAQPLSRVRPTSELVDVTRSALTVCVLSTFLQGPRELRSLAALRRLPTAPPSSSMRAIVVLLRDARDMLVPEPSEALRRLGDSDEPLLATVAHGAANYLWEHRGDLDRAVAAAWLMLQSAERTAHPWILFQAESRVSELALLSEDGATARRHALAAARLAETVVPQPVVEGLHLGLVLANLQCGDPAEAERWLGLLTGSSEESPGALPYGFAVQAEIRLARGETEEGLRLWRAAVGAGDDGTEPVDPRLRSAPNPLTLEVQSVAVVSHALHGQLHRVEEVVRDLPATLTGLLDYPLPYPPAYFVPARTWGTVLVALAVADIDRGTRTGDTAAVRWGARMVALAERCRYLRQFHPSMSSARIRRFAERADGPAYTDAVSTYASLDPEELHAAVREALRERQNEQPPEHRREREREGDRDQVRERGSG